MTAVSRGTLLFCLALACALGCGEGEGEVPLIEHDPPVIIEAYKSAASVAHGGTVTLRLTVQEEPEASLQFAWKPDAGALGEPTTLAASSEVVWTAPNCVFVDTVINIQASVTNSWGLSAHKTLTIKVLAGCLSWIRTPNMSTPRAQHTATVLPSGKVLIVGGTQLSVFLDSAELCDVTQLP